MNARIATPLVLTALTLALTACGNKGPLVLPTEPAPQEAPVAKPGEVPVTISTANNPPVATDPNAKTSLPTLPPLDGSQPAAEGAKDADTQDKDGDGKDDAKPVEPVPQGDG
ncbi:LPS translocon maturation chaperone LptM [Lysobacter antibioticus]|uniref:LPS translocon maturation chaperone LptM n=1 Tax=Lysobacter TaxID=68 RepID=UPI00056A3F37|nr:lipoprotein [Lysobacter antibioticus]